MCTRILVPVDDSPAAAAAAREAARLARASRGTAHLLSIVDEDLVYSRGVLVTLRETYMQELQAAANKVLSRMSRVCARAGVRCQTHLAEGRVVPAILQQAASLRADLIVLGAKQKGKLAGLLAGDRAQEVARQTHLPVLLVPARRPRLPASGSRGSARG
jgi:nucleotide-binding universal stress UspA family protein